MIIIGDRVFASEVKLLVSMLNEFDLVLKLTQLYILFMILLLF